MFNMDGLQLLGEGFGSKVYLSSDDTIIRVAKNWLTRGKHEREKAVLDFLKERIKSVAIPQPQLVAPSTGFPFGAMKYHQLPGRPLRPQDITPESRGNIAGQIAAFIHEMHSVPLDTIQQKVSIPSYIP